MMWEVTGGGRTLFIVDAANETQARCTVSNALNGSFWNISQLNMFQIPEKEEEDVQVEGVCGTEAG